MQSTRILNPEIVILGITEMCFDTTASKTEQHNGVLTPPASKTEQHNGVYTLFSL